MKKILIFVVAIAGFALFIYFSMERTKAGASDPGTVADPLVSKSYVDQVKADLIAEIGKIQGSGSELPNDIDTTALYSYIDQRISEANGESGLGFVVIQAEPGKKIICEESTEVILRSGEVTVIGNATGDGVSDVTGGQDLKNGTSVIKNHLCIVPRSDGRGFLVAKSCYMMIKGKYEIQ